MHIHTESAKAVRYPLSKIFSFYRANIKGEGWFIVFALAMSLIGHFVWLYNTYAFSLIIDFVTKYIPGTSLRNLGIIVAVWGISILIRVISGFMASYVGIYHAEKSARTTEERAVQHLNRLDISWHEKENSGNKIKKIQRGSASITNFTRIAVFTGADLIANVFGAFIILFTLSPYLSLLIIVHQIVYFSISHSMRAQGIKANEEVNKREDITSGLYYEIVHNIRTVKVLGLDSFILRALGERISDTMRFIRKRISWFNGSSRVLFFYNSVIRISFIVYITFGILKGNYDLAFLVLFYGYFNTISNSAEQLSNLAQDIEVNRSNMSKLIEIMDEKPRIDSEHNKVNFPVSWNTLSLNSVGFTYDENSKGHVLNNITLDIKRGEKIGIVGLSGAGKSTLFKLLLKEYENYTGSISFDGIELSSILKKDYTNYVTPVLQETEVFNMTLKDNIVMSAPQYEHDEALLEHTINTAHIKDFLHKLPQGMLTLIGEKGVKLSGGEKQRLGIARAVFKKPQLLLLDEATSHLDIESEQKIQDSLAHFFKEVTAIVIAHRLSTIKEMDRIIVLEHGKIIEIGTWAELMNTSSRFKEFWDKQQKNEA